MPETSGFVRRSLESLPFCSRVIPRRTCSGNFPPIGGGVPAGRLMYALRASLSSISVRFALTSLVSFFSSCHDCPPPYFDSANFVVVKLLRNLPVFSLKSLFSFNLSSAHLAPLPKVFRPIQLLDPSARPLPNLLSAPAPVAPKDFAVTIAVTRRMMTIMKFMIIETVALPAFAKALANVADLSRLSAVVNPGFTTMLNARSVRSIYAGAKKSWLEKDFHHLSQMMLFRYGDANEANARGEKIITMMSMAKRIMKRIAAARNTQAAMR